MHEIFTTGMTAEKTSPKSVLSTLRRRQSTYASSCNRQMQKVWDIYFTLNVAMQMFEGVQKYCNLGTLHFVPGLAC